MPLISFLVLRRKCRTCSGRISWRYPLVELLSATLFFLIWSELSSDQLGQNPVLGVAAILFFWILLVISVYDLRHKIIPNQLVYPAIAVSILFIILKTPSFENLLLHLLSGLALFSFFALLWLVSRGSWMGYGDAKLALALGFMLGWPASLTAFFLSFWIGAVYGLGWAFLEWMRGSKGIKGFQIPFAPFLFAGGFFAFLWGDHIISWYVSLI